MKIKNLFLTVATTLATMAAVAQTDGFSYQAVIRNTNGELIKTQNVGLQLTIADSAAAKVMYKETQVAQTNEFGVLSVTVGCGKAQDGTKLSNVDWTKPAWLHIAIDTKGGTDYVDFGASKIQAVPVALYAARSGNSAQTVGVTNPAGTDDTLFEVKDKDGNVVFAVCPDGVHVYIDDQGDSEKVRRSGFYITGRDAKDGTPNNYFAVSDEGTMVFVEDNEDNEKVRRSGFYITGRDAKKDGEITNFLTVDGMGTQVFVDTASSDKVRRSGFYITGRDAKKDGEITNFLAVDGKGTQVFVDDKEGNDKVRRRGFYITGRDATKDGSATNYMEVAADGTQVHFDSDNSKVRRSGFYITGRDATKDDAVQAYLTVNPDSTRFYIDDFNIDLRKDAITINNESRLSWYPAKGIFTDGNSISTTASFKDGGDFGVITGPFTAGYECTASGEYSQAMGYKAKAEGNYSAAIGYEANAQKEYSFAFGKSAQAQGAASYAVGFGATAVSDSSFAVGLKANSEGDCSVAFGPYASTKKKRSVAIGFRAKAKEDFSTALGNGATASMSSATALGSSSTASKKGATAVGSAASAYGQYSLAIGSSMANGNYSIAIGEGIEVTSYGSVAIGLNNRTKSGSEDTWVETDPLFVIGNGKQDPYTTASDALIVYKNGNMTLYGNLTSNGSSSSSDFRLKKDIQPLNGSLDKVLKLRGVSFYWKSKEEMAAARGEDVNNMSYGYSEEKQIGVVAQEIEEVIPELVVTDNEGFKSVKYENITPLLIEAIKELKAEKDAQDKKIEALEAQLKEILEKLDKQ